MSRLDGYLASGLSAGLYRGAVVRMGWWRWAGHAWRVEDGVVVWTETYRNRLVAKRRTAGVVREFNALIP